MPLLNSAKLLFDLQQVNAIAHVFSGCLDPEAIARLVTDALVERFPCAFARLWLLESDQSSLRLVASSGLYTHIDGSFARVPMGAYKVGKIAQNRIPFLSNHLADEPWVKDREWAIANNIQGFAGYPLVAGDRVLGVLVTFSHDAMAPEFLEVLQVLGMTVSVALDAALQCDQAAVADNSVPPLSTALSDQLATIFTTARIALVGTERSLPPSLSYGILRAAEILNQLRCHYCRLVYGDEHLMLETIVEEGATDGALAQCNDIYALAGWLGGEFTIQRNAQDQVMECLFTIPSPFCPSSSCQGGPYVLIQSQFSIIQTALMQLALSAGLSLYLPSHPVADTILMTDQPDQVSSTYSTIWICHSHNAHSVPIPAQAQATIDLSADAEHLNRLVHQVYRGEDLRSPDAEMLQPLSAREREVMSMLAQGLRDRDIAQQLYISESTVKFHVKNSLTKLKGKNRYQAVYEATQRRWI